MKKNRVILISALLANIFFSPLSRADTPVYSDPILPSIQSISAIPVIGPDSVYIKISLGIETHVNPLINQIFSFLNKGASQSPLSAPCSDRIETAGGAIPQIISKENNPGGTLTNYEFRFLIGLYAKGVGASANNCLGDYSLQYISLSDIARHSITLRMPLSNYFIADGLPLGNYAIANQSSNIWPTVTPPCPATPGGYTLCNFDVSQLQNANFTISSTLVATADQQAIAQCQSKVATLASKITDTESQLNSALKSLDAASQKYPTRVTDILAFEKTLPSSNLPAIAKPNDSFCLTDPTPLNSDQFVQLSQDIGDHLDAYSATIRAIQLQIASFINSLNVPPAKSVAKKITCTKGKLTKIQKGISPKCPKGYLPNK